MIFKISEIGNKLPIAAFPLNPEDVTKPIALLLHGLTQNHNNIHKLANMLLSNFRVILIDLPGHGAAEMMASTAFNISDVCSSIEAVKKHLCANSGVILIGHSLGGYIAQLLAARRVINAAHLVLIATAGLETFSASQQQTVRNVFNMFYQATNGFPNIRSTPLAIIERYLTEMLAAQPAVNADSIMCPVLIIHGENDPLIPNQIINRQTKQQFLATSAGYFRNAKAELLLKVAHYPHQEATTIVYNLIKSFCIK